MAVGALTTERLVERLPREPAVSLVVLAKTAWVQARAPHEQA